MPRTQSRNDPLLFPHVTARQGKLEDAVKDYGIPKPYFTITDIVQIRLAKWYNTYAQKERAKIAKEITPLVLVRAVDLGCMCAPCAHGSQLPIGYGSVYEESMASKRMRMCKGTCD